MGGPLTHSTGSRAFGERFALVPLPGSPLGRVHSAVGFKGSWEDASCSLEEQGVPWVLTWV